MTGRIRFLTAGESHGPALTVILEGMPAGLPLTRQVIDDQLCRRQKGFGNGGRMKIERDRVTISAGVMRGRTTGAPICMTIANLDHANWQNKSIAPMTVPRPGHADLVGAIKYNHDDLRLSLERASARETAARVCAGAVCRHLLAEFGIEVGGFVSQIGTVTTAPKLLGTESELVNYRAAALTNELAIPLRDQITAVREEIRVCMRDGDTLGGHITVFASGLPAGLGSYVHWDRRLDGRISQALMSVQAMKGVEFGLGFEQATYRGTAMHDDLELCDAKIRRTTNRAAGLEGGVSTGEPIIARVAMKPISTTLTPRQSVDLKTSEEAQTNYERSDFCAVPRAVPILEAMLSYVLADSLMEKLGGDDLSEMAERHAKLRDNDLSSLKLHGENWEFGYER